MFGEYLDKLWLMFSECFQGKFQITFENISKLQVDILVYTILRGIPSESETLSIMNSLRYEHPA